MPSVLRIRLVFSFVIGILAGGMGIAGGMLMAPLLNEFTDDSDTSAATANFMGLFTSASTTAQ